MKRRCGDCGRWEVEFRWYGNRRVCFRCREYYAARAAIWRKATAGLPYAKRLSLCVIAGKIALKTLRAAPLRERPVGN